MKTISLFGAWNLAPVHTDVESRIPKTVKKIPMNLPGDVHSALLAKKLIPDPYNGKNELYIQWVGRSDWKVERTIDIPASFIANRQFITLERVDTFVHVLINGIEVGFCNNYFNKWRFEVTEQLHVGKNVITLQFDSAERHAIKINKTLPYPVPCSQWPVGAPHRNLIRKVQCHAGWDWGPCIMAFGVYGSIGLQSTDIGFIDYVNCTTLRNKKNWTANITATITSFKDFTTVVTANLSSENCNLLENKKKIECEQSQKVHFAEGENLVHFVIPVDNPELWYPAGCRPEDDDAITKFGESLHYDNPLYNLTVYFGKSGDNCKTIKTAFRTLKTVSQIDDAGRSLYFEVNGRRVFAKGSNWIPADALPARITCEKIDYLLTSLIKSNQNCIRVWGGGMYESNDFYELCDRKGILVWQDCMFACSMYPATPDFLDTVRKEIHHQVKRLQHHPCIALWCGNNEDVGALGWYEESKKNPGRYLVAYDRLNEGVIGNTIRELDPDRMFWPSSPCGGPDDFEDTWHSDGKGDMHFWSVWHEKKPFEAYLDIKPRFVSEFGYQSFSSLEEVKSYASDDQLNLTSPVMEYHQRSVGGNSIILENFSRYFRFPENFISMLYLSQVQQALAIKTAVEYWRSLMPHCMGAIYWQLNDVWPVASWSSIEYSGKWKLLHYAVRHFNAPIAVLPILKNEKLSISVINEGRNILNANLTIHFYAFNGVEKLCKTLPVSVQGDKVVTVFETSIAELPFLPNECFLFAELDCGSFTVSNTLFLAKQKECQILKPGLSVSVKENTKANLGTYEITLTAKYPAFYTALETSVKGLFSDNMLTVLPGVPCKVTFIPDSLNKLISLNEFEKMLTVKSLRDTYN
ncbi:MAG: hypothetical protein BKP49_02210 [Treponema sp. CETP13]|nr:MAG: hypothetical protein BKP49_02210 [Treponema sp. CETP13]